MAIAISRRPVTNRDDGKITVSDSPDKSERRHCVTIRSRAIMQFDARFSDRSSGRDENQSVQFYSCAKEEKLWIRRHFLNLVFGVAAGVAAFAATANAAPLPPISLQQSLLPPRADSAEPAVIGQDEVDRLKPEQVRWHHHHAGTITTGITGIITTGTTTTGITGITTTGITTTGITGIIATTGITTTSDLILVLPRTYVIFVSLSLRRSEPAGLG